MMNSCIKFFWEDILSHPNTLKSESNFFSDRKNISFTRSMPISSRFYEFAALVVMLLVAAQLTISNMENSKSVMQLKTTVDSIQNYLQGIHKKINSFDIKMASFNMTEINENIKGLRKAAEAVLL